jgi:hypothetical protein
VECELLRIQDRMLDAVWMWGQEMKARIKGGE